MDTMTSEVEIPCPYCSTTETHTWFESPSIPKGPFETTCADTCYVCKQDYKILFERRANGLRVHRAKRMEDLVE